MKQTLVENVEVVVDELLLYGVACTVAEIFLTCLKMFWKLLAYIIAQVLRVVNRIFLPK
jgi:hypothetical protein